MYSDHFGLTENPFTPLSSASRPFRSKELEEALSHFQYARLNRESFFLLVGEVGTGKSTAVRAIVEALGPEFPVAVVSHTRLDPRELLEEVLRNFGVDSQGATSKSQMLGALEGYLSSATEDSPAVLIIDEAHLLSHAALEELRLLSNLQDSDRPLLQICLVGQPELLERLRQHRLRPLRQRIAVRYVFGNLTRKETRDYLWHRLAAAGAVRPHAIFTMEAADAVHAMTEGLPREINVVAGQAMLNAYLENAPAVRREHVRSTKHDYGFEGVRVAKSEPDSAPQHPLEEKAPEAPPPVLPPPVRVAPTPIARAPVPRPVPAPEPPPPPPPRPRPPELSTRFEPPEREPDDLALQEEELFASEIQSSSRGTRTLVIATAVVAVGILATLAFLLYPKSLVGKAAIPDPPPATSASPADPPATEIEPLREPDVLEPLPPTTTTSPPVAEPREDAPAPEAAAPRPVLLSTQPIATPPPQPIASPPPQSIAPPPPQPVSRDAVAADSLERGVWLWRNGSLDGAIAAFREALAINPGYIDALYNLGSSLLEKGELDESVKILRQAISVSPNHGLAQRSLGIALRQSGSLVEAAASLSRAVELMPNDVFALRHLASVLQESGDLERAVEASQKAVALTPNDAGVQQELGFALRAAGRLPEASAALQRSVELDGSLAQARYTLGVTLLEMGNRDAGEREIAEARRLGYNPP